MCNLTGNTRLSVIKPTEVFIKLLLIFNGVISRAGSRESITGHLYIECFKRTALFIRLLIAFDYFLKCKTKGC